MRSQWHVGSSPVQAPGGVAAGGWSGLQAVLGSLVGVAVYLALAGLILAAYYTLDSSFFPVQPEARPISDSAVYMTTDAFAVAVGMLFMPVRPFLNFFSPQALYRRGLRRAYIFGAARRGEATRAGVVAVSRDSNWPLLKELKV